jgi:hypothetical protein
MSRCPGCDNRIHCRLCDGGDDPVKVAKSAGFHEGTAASRAEIERLTVGLKKAADDMIDFGERTRLMFIASNAEIARLTQERDVALTALEMAEDFGGAVEPGHVCEDGEEVKS